MMTVEYMERLRRELDEMDDAREWGQNAWGQNDNDPYDEEEDITHVNSHKSQYFGKCKSCPWFFGSQECNEKLDVRCNRKR
jgi:hypothetical protein